LTKGATRESIAMGNDLKLRRIGVVELDLGIVLPIQEYRRFCQFLIELEIARSWTM
jgi:hypothetical protein